MNFDERVAHHKAMLDPVVAAMIELEAKCVEHGYSFPDALRYVLEQAEAHALKLGRSLVDTRPGSWEAAHIEHLAAGGAFLEDAG